LTGKIQRIDLENGEMQKGELANLAVDGAKIAVRVTPKAARNRITCDEGRIRIYVTTVPEGGKATQEVVKLLAHALGVAKSRLELQRGAASRDKVFKLIL